eukprot:scaffold33644_cov63-Phaeocystis_antarctica.AAC.4
MPRRVWSMTTSSASLAHALVQLSTRMAEHPGGRASGMPGSDKLFAAPCGMHDATHPRGSVVKFSASPLLLSALPEGSGGAESCPPPHAQHMASEEKSMSSYKPQPIPL